MNLSRRHLLRQILTIAGAAFVLPPSREWPFEKLFDAKQSNTIMNDDLVAFFENAMIARWELYYTGGAIRAAHDLDTWMKEITKLSQGAQGTDWQKRTLVLLTMSYQLQSCVLRDMMEYTQAQRAYQRAFHVAQELDDPELMSAALARKGVMLIQQERPKEAIIYLHGALDTIDGQSFPRLKGHILQGLSEAYAKTQQTQECWHSLGQAEEMLAQQQQIQERSLVRFNAASVAAQRGIDAVLLQDYQRAITQLDTSLTRYDPTLIRGRARLIAQKAEAYYGLGEIDTCVTTAEEALTLAHAVGASKTIARVKDLHATLTQSHWRKEQSVARLSERLSL